MRIEDPNEEREDGYTWENMMRLRGYSEELIQELAQKRRDKERVLSEQAGENFDN